MSLIGRFGTLLAGALGGSASSQFPEFYQQYLQRLGGRLDQAVIQAERIKEAARAEGMTLVDYVHSFASSDVAAHRRQAEILVRELAEPDQLRATLEALSQSAAWQRPFVLISRLDSDSMSATASIFQPAVPLTPEGFVYAGAGALLGILLLRSLFGVRRLFRRPVRS